MPTYCVNKNAQTNGDHEVHDLGACSQLPEPANRLSLGWHLDCRFAVAEARKTYSQVNGCYRCCRPCHTS